MGGFRRVAVVTVLVMVSGFLGVSPAAAARLWGPTPTIVGRAVVGQTLNAHAGTWRPANTRITYQWFRLSGGSRAAIPGATRASYRVQSADAGHPLAVRVTGTVSRSKLSLWSAATATVARPSLAPTPTPTIAGVTRVGRVLSARPGAWGPAPVSLSYQWYRDGAAVPGARSSSYLLRGADLGHRLSVGVTGSKAGFASVSRRSAPTAVVALPTLTLTPSPAILGRAQVARTLYARVGAWGPAPVSLSYQWFRDGHAISGAHGSAHLVRVADLGHRLSVRVTGFKPGYAPTSRWSASTAAVRRAVFTRAPAPRISGTVEVGQTLTADPGTWRPGGVKLKSQWYCDGVAIKGATGTSYLLRPGDLGCVMRVKATGSKPGYATLRKPSSPTLPVQASRVQVSAGGRHTCLVTAQGGLRCWGSNSAGQVGDGTTIDRFAPAPVAGLASGVRAVAAGARHTCALTRAGGVKCWGANAHGQLGDGGTTDRSTPVDVVGLGSGVSAIFAGYDYSCAVLDTGRVQCWGVNNVAQLGETAHAWNSPTPVAVGGGQGRALADVVAIAPGGYAHACAINIDGGVNCWGWNVDGELGNGTAQFAAGASAVIGLGRTPIVAVGVGALHSCAVTGAGGVRCWGRGADGQLGNGKVTEQHAPKAVPKLTRVAGIAVGGWHTCALLNTGRVRCWGAGADGELGNGHAADSASPVPVAGLSGVVVSLSAGGSHSCAVVAVAAGSPMKVTCWGDNRFGQLGDGTTGDPAGRRATPVEVVGL